MIVSRKVINQWLDLSRISDKELAIALNHLGFEVERILSLRKANTKLVVGEIVAIEKHSQSKQLSICMVNIGKEVLRIICKASNIAVGIKVVVAQINSCLATGIKIAQRTILGIISQGMLCSYQELGLKTEVLTSDENVGIIHLPDYAIIGDDNPLKFLELDDTIFEIALTINRSDCLSMYQIVQELANYFSQKPDVKMAITNFTFTTKAQIDINSNCLEALAALKVKIKHNGYLPRNILWKKTLQLAGISSNHFFDDLINIVMLEIGQPLVAFDSSQIKNFKIYDASQNYHENTMKIYEKDILFHDNYLAFSNLGYYTANEYQVKKTSKIITFVSLNAKLKLMQEQIKKHGSQKTLLLERLTKPIVPDYYLIALQRLLYLLRQEGVNYEILAFTNDLPYTNLPVTLSFPFTKINNILGIKSSKAEMINFLRAIGCSVTESVDSTDAFLTVVAPIHRNDLNNVNDYAEEIARLIGYNKLVSRPILLPTISKPADLLKQLVNDLSIYLLNNGFDQVKTYALTSKEKLKMFNFFNYHNPVTLIAPISSNREVMRFSLVESLVEIAMWNHVYKQPTMKIFTDDVIYTNDQNSNDHYVSLLLMPDEFLSKLAINNKSQIFFYLKGMIMAFLKTQLASAIVANITCKVNKNETLHPYLNSSLSFDDMQLVTFGAINLTTLKNYDLDDSTYVAEINCSRILTLIEKNVKSDNFKFARWTKYNPLIRDLSMIISNEITFMMLETAINAIKVPFLINFKVIDLYKDEELEKQDKYAITLSFQFNSFAHQLDEQKIAVSWKNITSLFVEKFAANIR